MGNTKNVMDFMQAARAVEDKRIAMNRGWENLAFLRRMEEIFKEVDGCQATFESFEIAALLASSMKLEHTYRTDYSRVYNCVKDFIVNPFTCTVYQLPGRTEKEFEYEVANVVKMKPLGKLAYDDNGEWGKEVVNLFVHYCDYHAKMEKILMFSDELKALYNKFMSK